MGSVTWITLFALLHCILHNCIKVCKYKCNADNVLIKVNLLTALLSFTCTLVCDLMCNSSCLVLHPQWGRDDLLPADPVGVGDGLAGKWSQPLCVSEARSGWHVSQQDSRLLQLPLLLFSWSKGDCGVWRIGWGVKELSFVDYEALFEFLCF